MGYKPRKYYLEKIKPFVNKQIIKVILGQRRVGKSYFLLQIKDFILSQTDANVIYINKERLEFKDIVDYQTLYDYVKQHSEAKKLNVLFLDEVQEISGFERALRSLLAEGNYDIYITGSNSRLLSGELASILTGRFVQITMFPLTYAEFLEFHGLADSFESFDKYLIFGGMPYLINLPLEQDATREYLQNLYQSILLKDVVQRFKVRNVDFLQRLAQFIALNVGSYISAKRIRDYLKSQGINISVNLVLDYLHYLETAFLVSRVKRFDLQGKQVLEVGEKVYFTDFGLRNSITDYRPEDVNKALENVVYNQLRVLGYQVFVGKLKDLEIDFIAKRGEEKIYLQVAYSLSDEKVIDREFGNLQKIKDNYPKYVITNDTVSFGIREGIKHLKVREFLLDFK